MCFFVLFLLFLNLFKNELLLGGVCMCLGDVFGHTTFV